MLSKKKQKALLVASVTGLILIALVSVLGFLAYLVFPLLVTLIVIIVGMITKWSVEWLIKNRQRFKIKERAKIVKKKLRIEEGVDLVKESIDTLRNKSEKDREDTKG